MLSLNVYLRAQTVTIPVLHSSVSFSPAAGPASFGLASGAWQATVPSSEAASHNHVLFAVASYQLPHDFTPTAGESRLVDKMHPANRACHDKRLDRQTRRCELSC